MKEVKKQKERNAKFLRLKGRKRKWHGSEDQRWMWSPPSRRAKAKVLNPAETAAWAKAHGFDPPKDAASDTAQPSARPNRTRSGD